MASGRRIGFVSTRLAGTDGVSLETAKWSSVLTGQGHECFYFAGQVDWPPDRSYSVPEAHFAHPMIRSLTNDLFDNYVRDPASSRQVEHLKNLLKDHLHRFLKQFDIELLVIENALAIPMNIPLGLALTELIAETGLPAIAHHHDFSWERARFAVSGCDDYLRAAFPPTLNTITHVVINTYAQRQLAYRAGVSSIIIPNVMPFDSPPPAPDGYATDLREALGIEKNEFMLLQPTRVVPRKRIERTLELARRLDLPCTIVISHESGDENGTYLDFLRTYIDLLGVRVKFAHDRIGSLRQEGPEGIKIYSLADVYTAADLVTYPSTLEGFGNAFLEAVYYRKPIVLGTYEIYQTDIAPKGFKVISFGEFLANETVEQARYWLTHPEATQEIVDQNYELARQHYSFSMLEKHLVSLVTHCLGQR